MQIWVLRTQGLGQGHLNYPILCLIIESNTTQAQGKNYINSNLISLHPPNSACRLLSKELSAVNEKQ